MSLWKVSVNGKILKVASSKKEESSQFKDIKRKINKKMGVNKNTIVKPDIYIIDKIK